MIVRVKNHWWQVGSLRSRDELRRLRRSNQRRPHRFGHAEENHGGVAGKVGGERLVANLFEPGKYLIPTVRNPDVAGGIAWSVILRAGPIGALYPKR